MIKRLVVAGINWRRLGMEVGLFLGWEQRNRTLQMEESYT